MEFLKLKGWVPGGQEFISLEISGGSSDDCIGDQVWVSPDGRAMEVYAYSDRDVLEETMKKFRGQSSRAFRGALLRMGVSF